MKVHVPAMGSECQLLHEMSTKTRETTQQDTKRSIPLAESGRDKKQYNTISLKNARQAWEKICSYDTSKQQKQSR